jgi:hypothetical protein
MSVIRVFVIIAPQWKDRGNFWIATHPFLGCNSVSLPKLFLTRLSLHCEIWVLLHFGLVEAVHDGILTLRYMYALDLNRDLGTVGMEM